MSKSWGTHPEGNSSAQLEGGVEGSFGGIDVHHDVEDRELETGGEVLFEGTPGQIISDPDVRRVYLGA